MSSKLNANFLNSSENRDEISGLKDPYAKLTQIFILKHYI
jgi:hypothetical protein